jgi:hypothetical protein
MAKAVCLPVRKSNVGQLSWFNGAERWSAHEHSLRPIAKPLKTRYS